MGVLVLSVSLVNSYVSFKPVLRFGYNPQSVGSDLGSAVLVPGIPNGGQIVKIQTFEAFVGTVQRGFVKGTFGQHRPLRPEGPQR